MTTQFSLCSCSARIIVRREGGRLVGRVREGERGREASKDEKSSKAGGSYIVGRVSLGMEDYSVRNNFFRCKDEVS